MEARAARTAEAHYERISLGEGEPQPHLGWLTTTSGVVLDGQIVLELRALIEQHRRAMTGLLALVRRPGVTARDLSLHLDDHVLPLDRRLLGALHRVLTEPQPRNWQHTPAPPGYRPKTWAPVVGGSAGSPEPR